MEGNEYWDHVGSEEMGGTIDDTDRHLQFLTGGITRSTVRAMEIGCGMGRLIGPLAESFSDIHWLGYDPSRALVRQAPQLLNIEYVTELPTGGRYDFIYSMLVFQHISNDAKRNYIHWASHHLTSPGRFWFQYVEGTYDADNNHLCTEDEMMKMCAEAGVRVLSHAVDEVQPEWRWVAIR